MNPTQFLSMTKAMAYLGDAASAQQLLITLKATLEADTPHIGDAIVAKNFETLQKILHQLKGFTPIFCEDVLVAQIISTESLCKHIDSDAHQATALSACAQLLANLESLLLEVSAQLQQSA